MGAADMAWAHFTGDHAHLDPSGQWSTDYKAGMRLQLPRAQLEAATAAGRAKAIDAPHAAWRAALAADPFAADPGSSKSKG